MLVNLLEAGKEKNCTCKHNTVIIIHAAVHAVYPSNKVQEPEKPDSTSYKAILQAPTSPAEQTDSLLKQYVFVYVQQGCEGWEQQMRHNCPTAAQGKLPQPPM